MCKVVGGAASEKLGSNERFSFLNKMSVKEKRKIVFFYYDRKWVKCRMLYYSPSLNQLSLLVLSGMNRLLSARTHNTMMTTLTGLISSNFV